MSNNDNLFFSFKNYIYLKKNTQNTHTYTHAQDKSDEDIHGVKTLPHMSITVQYTQK